MKTHVRAGLAPAVHVQDLSVALSGQGILVDVRLAVPSGSWLCVIGPNGAGKTTLVHAIAGLVPRRGSIELWGRALERLGRRERGRSVAVVPQLPTVPEGITVEGYVLLGRTPHLGWLGVESRHDREAVDRVLERLELAWAASRRLETLSGGELRRVVLARALAQEAPLLLLDEPTAGLDLGQQLRVLELIEDLRRTEGLTVVSTMHDLTLAGRSAERFALLARGRVVAEGARAEVLAPHLIAEHYGAAVRVIDDAELGWAVVPISNGDLAP
jgi:iron complex transport system ATP-binding protein